MKSFRPCGESTPRLVGVVTCTMDLWKRCGMFSKPGSLGPSGGRTRITVVQLESDVREMVDCVVCCDLPTLTEVRPSSSEVRLALSCLLLTLGRLLLVDGR